MKNEKQMSLNQFLSAKEKFTDEFLLMDVKKLALSEEDITAQKNITGIGIGIKSIQEKSTDELCLKVYVKKKLAEEELPKKFVTPKKYYECPTDVEEVGEVIDQMYNYCYDPVLGGSSIGNYTRNSAGTLGCLINKNDGKYILSNNHVMALRNQATLGDYIVQPGVYDNGKHIQNKHPSKACNILYDNCITTLADFQTIVYDGKTPNYMDAAIAKPIPSVRSIQSRFFTGPPPTGTATVSIGDKVKKTGRTTGITNGVVNSVNTNYSYNTPAGPVFYKNLIVIKGTNGAFSDSGDSGSLVLTENNKAIGLHFAGDGKVSACSPIDVVLQRFNATISTSD